MIILHIYIIDYLYLFTILCHYDYLIKLYKEILIDIKVKINGEKTHRKFFTIRKEIIR